MNRAARLVLVSGIVAAVLLGGWTALSRTLIPLSLDSAIKGVGYYDDTGLTMQTLRLVDGTLLVVDGALAQDLNSLNEDGTTPAVLRKRSWETEVHTPGSLDLVPYLWRGEFARFLALATVLVGCCCVVLWRRPAREPVTGAADRGQRSSGAARSS